MSNFYARSHFMSSLNGQIFISKNFIYPQKWNIPVHNSLVLLRTGIIFMKLIFIVHSKKMRPFPFKGFSLFLYSFSIFTSQKNSQIGDNIYIFALSKKGYPKTIIIFTYNFILLYWDYVLYPQGGEGKPAPPWGYRT